MNVHDAFQSATQLLKQREQLLYGHLLRLVDGDKELFRAVKERLISEGLAEDRAGIALARVNSAGGETINRNPAVGSDDGSIRSDVSSESAKGGTSHLKTASSEWWLKSSGTTQGPFTLAALCEMRRFSEISPDDMVRLGTRDNWQPLDAVPELKAVKPILIPQTPLDKIDGQPKNQEESLVVIPLFSMDEKPAIRTRPHDSNLESPVETRSSVVGSSQVEEPVADGALAPLVSFFADRWLSAARMVGGSGRLIVGTLILVICYALYSWSQQLPDEHSIYAEFQEYHRQAQQLRPQTSSDPSNAGRAMASSYSRVAWIVHGLKTRSTGASAAQPVKQELLWAGESGLLKILGGNGDDSRAVQEFESHMNEARRLLDGGVRSVPVEVTAAPRPLIPAYTQRTDPIK